MSSKAIAIVTGASAGLGRAFALELGSTRELDEIWLIARRESSLQHLAQELLPQSTRILSLDLREGCERERLHEELKAQGARVRCLVNNAGLGYFGEFTESPWAELESTMTLNMTALIHLTHLILPFMDRGAELLQVASSIGFSPAPRFAVYAASKTFVLHFSRALRYELRGRGINVIAVCPGPVRTEFQSVASRGERPGNDRFLVEPGPVVAKALRDSQRGKAVSIYGPMVQLFCWLAPYIPDWLLLRVVAMKRRARP